MPEPTTYLGDPIDSVDPDRDFDHLHDKYIQRVWIDPNTGSNP